ncbi:MAG: HAMP domain-containing histidine kinase [Ktedonobacteraceae bacterium]|nr:HAMP domain-containing histidine kinase [Ktedonobacteraceae bacterium]
MTFRYAGKPHHPSQTDHLSDVFVSLARDINMLTGKDLYRAIMINMQALTACEHAVLYLYQQGAEQLLPVARFSGTGTGLPGKSDVILLSEQQEVERQQEQKKQQGQGISGMATLLSLAGESLQAQAAVHRRSLVREAPGEREERGSSPANTTRVQLALALLSRDVLYGVLYLERADPFSREELERANDLSCLVAIALENEVLRKRQSVVREELDEARRARAKFISTVTHELRAPIHSINGYLDLALSELLENLTPQLHEFISRARQASEQLFARLEDLLLLSRADGGQLHLNRRVCSLPEVIAGAIEEVELTAQDRHIAITVDIADDVPPLYADAERLQQMVRNLLSNALYATPDGGQVAISARLDDATGERRVRLAVRDNGQGIAAEFHERIFERFFQVPGGERSGGQGLGLAVVKTIVELHGGLVMVESAPGLGSNFLCVFPPE